MGIPSKKELRDFVKAAKKEIEGYDGYDVGNVKEVVLKAVARFGIGAEEKLEETDFGETEALHIQTEADENLLNDIVTLAIGDGGDATIAYLYEDYVNRLWEDEDDEAV